MSTTLVRILIVSGAVIGAAAGAFIAIAKALPERASIITGYQLKVIKALQEENEELAGKMQEMREEISELQGEIRVLKEDRHGEKAA